MYRFLLVLITLSACQIKNNEFDSNTKTALSSMKLNQNLTESNTTERTYTYWERELDYLKTIWHGEYDNVEQLDFDKIAKYDNPADLHNRVHIHIEKIQSSKFGAYVWYLEEYQNDDINDIVRQSIYVLSGDDEAKAIRIKVYEFEDKRPLLSSRQSVDFIQNLTPSAPGLIQGCDMLLRREGMTFFGTTESRSCLIDPNAESQFIDYQIRISENEFWHQEVIVDNKPISERQPVSDLPLYQLEKARCFICMIDFPREENGRPVNTVHYINIHDQGGKFEFNYLDGRPMVLGMRNTWSFGMQRETFVIFIQEESQKGKTLIYSWGEPGADRIGFNPGWIRVQCDLDNPTNQALQHALRPDS